MVVTIGVVLLRTTVILSNDLPMMRNKLAWLLSKKASIDIPETKHTSWFCMFRPLWNGDFLHCLSASHG